MVHKAFLFRGTISTCSKLKVGTIALILMRIETMETILTAESPIKPFCWFLMNQFD